MGFRYNALQSTTRYLAAGVLPDYPVNPAGMEYTNNANVAPNGLVTINYATPFGPQVAFYNPDAALTFIKVAFVHSRFDYAPVSYTHLTLPTIYSV